MFDEQELKNLLELSRLSVPSEKMHELSGQLQEILGYFERLSEFDTSTVDVDLGIAEPVDAKRRDDPAGGLDRDAIAEFSSTFDENGFFLVPRILGDDSE